MANDRVLVTPAHVTSLFTLRVRRSPQEIENHGEVGPATEASHVSRSF